MVSVLVSADTFMYCIGYRNVGKLLYRYTFRFMQISMYNFIMVFSDTCTVVHLWCAFQNKTLCTLYAHTCTLTCTCTCTLYTHVQLFFMCTFTCTVDEPDVKPKKKKHRISEDDGEESEHSVQGTVTKLHVHV